MVSEADLVLLKPFGVYIEGTPEAEAFEKKIYPTPTVKPQEQEKPEVKKAGNWWEIWIFQWDKWLITLILIAVIFIAIAFIRR